MSALFVDASAFIALADRSDDQHARARRFFKRIAREGRPLVTSTYIVDEAITFLRQSIGHAATAGFGEHLFSTRWCRIVEIDEPLRLAAWQLFLRYDDQVFSFTDCTSFALMQSMKLTDAFTFDGDFAAAGFTELPAG